MSTQAQPLYFREVQRPYWWVYLVVAAIAVLVATLTFNTGRSGIQLILAWAVGILGLPLITITLRQVTELRHDHLTVEIAPFWTREVPLTEVESAEAVTYKPLIHFGGWGIRYSPITKQWAYTMKGKQAVLLELADHKPLLVGTKRPDELAEAIIAVQQGS